eukprot:CAMPEP_0182552610 /NCGR_PEP_ID=MMETSP1323-20130603/48893_1 /TAXON_ID=236787 /ORGANISM="Florenciella parvula, Strain RCC1693" /LENGTH=36 /DNA_ID= /DNA_START= /DNA_END= /DNA_ORIENTATION=
MPLVHKSGEQQLGTLDVTAPIRPARTCVGSLHELLP